MAVFPSIKAAELRRLLERELGYYLHSQRGSHQKMRSRDGFPPLLFAFHATVELPPGLVRKILVTDIGLDEARALALLGMR